MSQKRLKLLKEEIDFQEIEILSEEDSGKKSFKIKGPFLSYDIKNANNRIYPKHLVDKEVQRYTNELINRNLALGEYKHTESPYVDRERACILTESLYDAGNNYYEGVAKLLTNFKYGRLVYNLLEEKIPVPISSRSLGTCDPYTRIVNDDYKICAFDVVERNPGNPRAWVDMVLEEKEYIIDNDVIVEVAIEKLQANLDKNGSKYITEALQSFLSTIKKI